MTLKSKFHLIIINSILILSFFLTTNCGIYKPVDARKIDPNVHERVKKNIEEGRGFRVMGGKKNQGGTFEFASSNAMWRASLEILDFIPMTTVDYSGGMIISDWYTDNSSSANESIKISVRFLSNEVRSDSLKIIIHKKICKNISTCDIKVLENSTIAQELNSTIIRKAAVLEKESKTKKK